MKCNVCKTGDLLKGKTTVTLRRGSTVVVIEDVEALVCNDCGNYYLDSPTASRVLTALDVEEELERVWKEKGFTKTSFKKATRNLHMRRKKQDGPISN